MTAARRKTPPSVDFVRRRLDRAIRAGEAVVRGFRQQANFTAGCYAVQRVEALQKLREEVFGMRLRTHQLNRQLFPRPRRRRKAA